MVAPVLELPERELSSSTASGWGTTSSFQYEALSTSAIARVLDSGVAAYVRNSVPVDPDLAVAVLYFAPAKTPPRGPERWCL